MPRTSTTSLSRREPRTAEVERVQRELQLLGVRPSRKLGQSFLVDEFVADAEAALVDAATDDPILEIGPGLGILTSALLRRGFRRITVIEKDRRLAAYIEQRFEGPLRVVHGDALTADLPEACVVVGNLPFSVATPILLRLFRLHIPRIVALLQKETADRLVAGPGSRTYGRLSVLAQLYGTPEAYAPVPSSSFFPQPEVAGRIVTHSARAGQLPVPSEAAFERLLRVLFERRRKQLKNLLARALPAGSDPAEWARAAGWPVDWSTRRPEEIPPEGYFALARALAVSPVEQR